MVAVTLASSQAPRPATCSDRCGNVEIPYPFGIEPSCYMEVPEQDEQQFKVTCDQATTPPLLKFLNGDILNQSITNISVGDQSEMQVMLPPSRHCYTDGYYNESLYINSELILPSGYTISDKNKFCSIRCNKIALYQGFVTQVEPERTEIEKLGTTGVSMCQDLLGALSNNCSGVGCTQRTIISGLHSINLDVWTIGTGLGSTSQWTLDYPCSYGFIVDDRNFTFAGNATFKEMDSSTNAPELLVAVNWEIGKDNCEVALNNQTYYACKAANTECVNDTSGGYFCRCQKGYQGNPYVLGGCQAKIFTRDELKKATNNFDDSGKIGEVATDLFTKEHCWIERRYVAIKVSKSNAPMTQSNQFINEVIVLSQINHRNVVRLLGCCLETQTPLLVYEFVSNGTLYEHIHKKNGKGLLSFGLRMKIAAETAGSLAYQHYSTSMQIVHRDVKATNILLDENFTAKVSDFGASKLVPEDQNQLATLVQGTLGFGVVLVELIKSQVAISHKKPEAERNLTNCFVTSVEENRLAHILDLEIIKEGSFEIAEQVAHLSKRCLSLKGGDRPTMKEVAILAVMAKYPGGKPDSSPKETDY
ncbi:hypothetical protein ACLB2K_023698 [Fragaria x ananassa]